MNGLVGEAPERPKQSVRSDLRSGALSFVGLIRAPSRSLDVATPGPGSARVSVSWTKEQR